MPKKIQDFARDSLIKPVLVNVGRAGAANLDVLQVVEYVKQEAKMVYLLECLQKTPPPVIIFSENKNEVDGQPLYVIKYSIHPANQLSDIQEYLLLKGVEAVAIHGSKSRLMHITWSILVHLYFLKVRKSGSTPSNPLNQGLKMSW